MATTIPASGPVSFATIQSAYGGSNPIGMNEYYRGGSYVDNTGVSNPNIPTNGAISVNNFRGTTAFAAPQVSTIGSQYAAAIYGSHYNSGGGSPGTLNNVLANGGGIGNSGGPWYIAPMGSGNYAPAGGSAILTACSSCINTWFPLIPTLYAPYGGYLCRSVLAVGTGDINNPVAIIGPIPPLTSNNVFCWRHPRSTWTNSMVQNFLGFNNTQLNNVTYATRVWWKHMNAGMDSYVATGFMIFSASTYNSSGAQTCYNNATKFYFTGQNVNGGEWSQQGFDFTPTVNGSGFGLSLSNVGITVSASYDGYGNFVAYVLSWQGSSVWNGSAFRATEYIYGAAGEQYNTGNVGTATPNLRSDYTYTIGVNDLVIPMMYDNNGFSGAAFDGNRNPLTVQFGQIQVV